MPKAIWEIRLYKRIIKGNIIYYLLYNGEEIANFKNLCFALNFMMSWQD